MQESYCGLCDDCHLGAHDFQEAVAKVRAYLDQFRVQWWSHCFPGEEGFSFTELRRGLDWFLFHPECPGCHGGKGLDLCPIRVCARRRGHQHCYECPDLEDCDKFAFILAEFPQHKTRLHRRQLKHRAQELHTRKTED